MGGRALIAAVVVLSDLTGCGGGSAPEEATSFIAFASSFATFRTWEPFHRADRSEVPGCVHTTCERTDYLSARPPAGSTAFPMGTIIVKDMMNPAGRQVFAMVKRGGGYNAAGATGWEWFELEEAGGDLRIRWRGLGAPDGEHYGLPGQDGGCNQCHGGARDNDFVQAPDLKLADL